MSQGTLESAGIFQNNIYPKNNMIITTASDHVYSKVNCALSAARLLGVYCTYPNPWLPADLEVSKRHLDLGTCVFWAQHECTFSWVQVYPWIGWALSKISCCNYSPYHDCSDHKQSESYPLRFRALAYTCLSECVSFVVALPHPTIWNHRPFPIHSLQYTYTVHCQQTVHCWSAVFHRAAPAGTNGKY